MQSRTGQGGQDSGAVQEQRLRNPYLVEVGKPTLIEYRLCQLLCKGLRNHHVHNSVCGAGIITPLSR